MLSIRSFAGNDNADAAAESAKAVPAGATVLVAAIDLDGTHAVPILEALANPWLARSPRPNACEWSRTGRACASKRDAGLLRKDINKPILTHADRQSFDRLS